MTPTRMPIVPRLKRLFSAVSTGKDYLSVLVNVTALLGEPRTDCPVVIDANLIAVRYLAQ
jgi:hypothetical protein